MFFEFLNKMKTNEKDKEDRTLEETTTVGELYRPSQFTKSCTCGGRQRRGQRTSVTTRRLT